MRFDAARTGRALRLVVAAGVGVALVAVWLARVSVPGAAPRGCPAGCERTAERTPGPLRVLTFNLWHDFPRFRHLELRLAHVADELQRLDVDIVCLQEVAWTWRLGNAAGVIAERAGFNHLYYRANGNRRAILFEEGVAILSRFPLERAAGAVLEPAAGRFEHRVALHAQARTPDAVLDVFCVHLTQARKPAHAQQLGSLIAFVDARVEHLGVIAGDFNALDSSSRLLAQPAPWFDSFHLAGAAAPPTCCRDKEHLDGSLAVRKRVDYVFVRPSPRARATVRSSRAVMDAPFDVSGREVWPSDHLGVLAEIAL